jgi:hypothetical protein
MLDATHSSFSVPVLLREGSAARPQVLSAPDHTAHGPNHRSNSEQVIV